MRTLLRVESFSTVRGSVFAPFPEKWGDFAAPVMYDNPEIICGPDSGFPGVLSIPQEDRLVQNNGVYAMSYQIITDSCCDLTQDQLKARSTPRFRQRLLL